MSWWQVLGALAVVFGLLSLAPRAVAASPFATGGPANAPAAPHLAGSAGDGTLPPDLGADRGRVTTETARSSRTLAPRPT